MLASLFQVGNVIFRHLPLRYPAHGRITYSEPRLAMVVVCSAAGALPNRVPLWGDGRHASVAPFISQSLYKIAHSGRKVVWQKFTLKSDNHEPRPVDADGRASSYPFARGLQVGKVQRNPRPYAVKRAAR